MRHQITGVIIAARRSYTEPEHAHMPNPVCGWRWLGRGGRAVGSGVLVAVCDLQERTPDHREDER